MIKTLIATLKNRIGIFLTALLCCLLTSCFDLLEQIDINSQGSGTIKATLNLSKSSTKVASLMKLKEFNGIAIPSETDIRREMAQIVSKLKTTQGISDVQYELDFDNYIAHLSCSFNNLQALNNFSQTLSKRFEIAFTRYNSYHYDTASRSFTRSYRYSPEMGEEFAKISENDKQLFDDAYYTNIMRFDKPIHSQNNPNAKVSTDKKAVMLRVQAIDLIQGKTDLSNTITLIK